MKTMWYIFLLVLSLHCVDVLGCNEAVCAPIVSKCMLTQSCKCDFKANSTCSRICYHCLDYLYNECCSCVEMCPKTNETDSILSSKSHVEELLEPQPELFQVLTEEEDRLLRWKSFSIPAELKFVTDIGHKDISFTTKVTTTDSDGVDQVDEIPVNCTVTYMSQCMSWNKCKASCTSMGASSYRWFHDGCCECVGKYCINYGINESRCLQCPLANEGGENEENENRQDYEFENENGAKHEDEDNKASNGVNDKTASTSKSKEVPEKKPHDENVISKKTQSSDIIE